MSFYVYENWQAGPRKAVIHRGTCGHCNDGRGRAGGYDPAHAQWHPQPGHGFVTLAAARSFAQALARVVVVREDRCV